MPPPSITNFPARLDAMRSSLPIEAYLQALHTAATSGMLRRYTVEGEPTDQYDEIPLNQRLDLTRWLFDKIVPDAKAAPTTGAETLQALLQTNDRDSLLSRIANMPLANQRALLAELDALSAIPIPPEHVAHALTD